MARQGIDNPDIVTGFDNKAHWDMPDYRRSGFHILHATACYSLSFRAPRVLPLRKEIDWTIP
ncbi:MAG: hypothetical protein GDA49_09755 [Rhodospirillales bacterium]|nr:hypothetical protein [Rhodospirillales bacterium]